MDLEANYTSEISEITSADNVRKTIADLSELVEGTGPISDVHLRVLARGVQLTLVAVASSMGECQLDVPYSPMHPVLNSTGQKWCCNHPTQHCS